MSNTPDAEYFNRSKSTKISYTTPGGAQDFTVYGDAYSNARAGLPFINASSGAINNGGTAGPPSSFAGTSVASDPGASTYSNYFGSPAYKVDVATGYPVNTGAGLRRLSVGFRTGDHTGSSVSVTAEGPGALFFTGYMHQTDIFFNMAAALSTDTSEGDKVVELLKSSKYPQTVVK